MKKRKVVVFGGGNGSATTLRAMKRNIDLFDISAVISVSDSGGSSGQLREEFNTLPAGDILRAVLALSPIGYRSILKPYFYGKRFENTGKLDGHNLGNLFLVLAANYCGDFVKAIRALEQAVRAQGKVYPASLDNVQLAAELTNGEIVQTEAKLDRPDYDRNLKIKKVYLDPPGEIYSEVKKVIEEADFILLGPGSLYTSVVASILPKGIKEAIDKSKAKLVYIAGNKYEMEGETGPTALHEFVAELEKYLPRKLDSVIFNNMKLTKEQAKHYEEKKWKLIDSDMSKLKDYLVFSEPFERQSGGLSAERLGMLLREALS